MNGNKKGIVSRVARAFAVLVGIVGFQAALLITAGVGVSHAGITDKWCVGPSDDVCLGEDLELRSNIYVTNRSSQPALNVSSQIAPDKGYAVVESSGGVVTLTSTPQIKTTFADGTTVQAGAHLVLRGLSDANAIVLTDDDSSAGSKLELGATTRTLGLNDLIELLWDPDSDRWLEKSYTNLN